MATLRITAPEGAAPEGITQEELRDYLKASYAQAGPPTLRIAAPDGADYDVLAPYAVTEDLRSYLKTPSVKAGQSAAPQRLAPGTGHEIGLLTRRGVEAAGGAMEAPADPFRRSGPWIAGRQTPSVVARNFADDVGVPQSESTRLAQPVQTTPAPQRSVWDSLGRQASLFARHAIVGPAQTVELFTSPVRLALQLAGLPTTPESVMAAQLADRLGLAKPETRMERLTGDVVGAVIGGGVQTAAARKLLQFAKDPIVNAAVRHFADEPAMQLVGAAGDGFATGIAREAGATDLGQKISGFLGGAMASSGAKAAIGAAGKAFERAAQRHRGGAPVMTPPHGDIPEIPTQVASEKTQTKDGEHSSAMANPRVVDVRDTNHRQVTPRLEGLEVRTEGDVVAAGRELAHEATRKRGGLHSADALDRSPSQALNSAVSRVGLEKRGSSFSPEDIQLLERIGWVASHPSALPAKTAVAGNNYPLAAVDLIKGATHNKSGFKIPERNVWFTNDAQKARKGLLSQQVLEEVLLSNTPKEEFMGGLLTSPKYTGRSQSGRKQ
ncbi:hypothetical protein [Comamonas terrigena]|uniref:hypothetical protein n=1 Tax=Comamonas terrigena TaxID=32013 RepID=UPI002353F000|nr:hypothetical protein [Comamonas terrigena]